VAARVPSAGTARARNGAESGVGVGFSSAPPLRNTAIATNATAMSTVTPKNGPRQLTEPSRPPIRGPIAMPRPSAASYRMMAEAVPPDAAPTIVARAVEMNRALPRPQPARNPMISHTSPLVAASRANRTISARPIIRVFFAPSRLDTQLVKNMAMPVTAR
jgi:hypothetical protein